MFRAWSPLDSIDIDSFGCIDRAGSNGCIDATDCVISTDCIDRIGCVVSIDAIDCITRVRRESPRFRFGVSGKNDMALPNPGKNDGLLAMASPMTVVLLLSAPHFRRLVDGVSSLFSPRSVAGGRGDAEN